jgi:hypothetical protein
MTGRQRQLVVDLLKYQHRIKAAILQSSSAKSIEPGVARIVEHDADLSISTLEQLLSTTEHDAHLGARETIVRLQHDAAWAGLDSRG